MLAVRGFALAAALALFTLPALAAGDSKLTDDQKAEAMDFAMHDAVFTLFHESGHLLIHELGLPVLGHEEDAADAIGVLQIFNTIKDPDELENTMNDVADGWYWSWQNASDDEVSESVASYDDHSLDIQRANAIVCMMVGAEPEKFDATATDFQFDDDTKDGCADTYKQAKDSWDNELAPHVAKTPGPAIPVTYEAAGKYQTFADELKKRHILENLSTTLSTSFALPRPLKIVATQCDEANAYYAEETHSITYCYELAEDEYNLAIKNMFSDDKGASDQSDDSEDDSN
jgi:hypothetical protein